MFASSQLVRHLGSIFILFDNAFNDLLLLKSIVSSAKRLTTEYGIALYRSLIYRRNNRGPRTDPWGTPWRIVLRFEERLEIETNCFTRRKKRFEPRIP